jgi:hypothetical protein
MGPRAVQKGTLHRHSCEMLKPNKGIDFLPPWLSDVSSSGTWQTINNELAELVKE